MKEVVNVFPAVCPTTPPPPKHTLTHSHTLVRAEVNAARERVSEREREGGGESRSPAREG